MFQNEQSKINYSNNRTSGTILLHIEIISILMPSVTSGYGSLWANVNLERYSGLGILPYFRCLGRLEQPPPKSANSEVALHWLSLGTTSYLAPEK